MTIEQLKAQVITVQYIYRRDSRPYETIATKGFVPWTGVDIDYFKKSIYPVYEPGIATSRPNDMTFPTRYNKQGKFTFPQFYVCFSADTHIYSDPEYRIKVNFHNMQILSERCNDAYSWILFSAESKTYLAIGQQSWIYEIDCLDEIKDNIEIKKGINWSLLPMKIRKIGKIQSPFLD